MNHAKPAGSHKRNNPMCDQCNFNPTLPHEYMCEECQDLSDNVEDKPILRSIVGNVPHDFMYV